MATKSIMTTTSTYIDISTNRSFSFSNSTMTYSSEMHSSWWTFLLKLFAAMGVVSAVSAALILSCCLLLFVVVLSSAELRRQTRNHVLLSLTLAHFCVGALDSSFVANLGARFTHNHGCYFNIVRSLVLLSAENFVSMWAVVQMLALYVARLRRWTGPACLKQTSLCGCWGGAEGGGRVYHNHHRCIRQLLHVFLVSAPWLTSLLLMVPVAMTGLWSHHMTASWNKDTCYLVFTFKTSTVLAILGYYLPALVIIALCVAVVVLNRSRRGRGGIGRGEEGGDGGGNMTCITTAIPTNTATSNSSRAEMGQALVERDNQETEAPLVYLLTACFSLLCLGPNHIMYSAKHVLRPALSLQLLWAIQAGFEILDDLVAVLHIITWFVVFADLRQRLKELVWMVLRRLPCCPGREPPELTGDSRISPVSFRELRDE